MLSQSKHEWKYPISECDVIDRVKLVSYRELAEHWHNLMYGDEEYSVWNQISDLLWQDIVWRSFNEARRWTDEDGPTAAVAPLVAGLLDRGFFTGQVLGISRLTDASDPKHPKRGVVSLRRLVDEIVSNKSILTREIFVSHDGLPYDWESVSRSEIAALPRADQGQAATWLPMDGPTAWSSAHSRHKQFDLLANTMGNTRFREDLIGEDLLIPAALCVDANVSRSSLGLNG